jgi:hypothetical protein
MLGTYLAKRIRDGLGFFERDGIDSSFCFFSFFFPEVTIYIISAILCPWWNGSYKRPGFAGFS